MDINMEDVSRLPADLPPLQNLEPASIPTVDGWIESLMNCKQLSELDVQRLCEKVGWSYPGAIEFGDGRRISRDGVASDQRTMGITLPVHC